MSERHAALLLRSSLAAVLGGQAAAFLLTTVMRDPMAGSHWHEMVVCAVEVAGAALLLVPRLSWAGGCLLLTSLALATVVHGAMREAPPPSFAVYVAATWWIMRSSRRAEVRGT
jgi:hypothetical protein